MTMTVTKRVLGLLVALGCACSLGCASAPEDRGESDVSSEDALRSSRNRGAVALLGAAANSAAPKFLRCRTAPKVTPNFELDVYTSTRAGSATIVIRHGRSARTMTEQTAQGTLDGIPRAGDLQGTVAFTLGNKDVEFNYVAESVDEANELVFDGTTIPLLCNAG